MTLIVRLILLTVSRLCIRGHAAELAGDDIAVWLSVVAPSRYLRYIAFACLLPFAAAAPAHAKSNSKQSGKTDRGVRDAMRGGAKTVRVIVRIDDPAVRNEIRRSLQAHGDVIKSDQPLVNAFAAEVHTDDIERLATHPSVRFVSLDAVVSAGAADYGPGAAASASQSSGGANSLDNWI